MMIKIFPNISNKVNERMKDNFEGLDTIVIEEIIMPEVIELLKKDEDKEKLKEIFEYFEEICLYSDEYMNNVFSITVLEILGNEKMTGGEFKTMPEEIDIVRANEAKIRAERRLKGLDGEVNVDRAAIALRRSIARIQAAEKYGK